MIWFVELAKNDKVSISVSWAIVRMTSNSAARIFDRNDNFIIQVEYKCVSIANKLVFSVILFNTSPFCGSEPANAGGIFNLNETDGRSNPVAPLMEVLRTPPVFSRVEDHFDRHQFLTQVIDYVLNVSWLLPYEWGGLKVVLWIDCLECELRVLKWLFKSTLIFLLFLSCLNQCQCKL